MGARQSKRSVDISGKEAESAGEVAAAGAGGEGRVEQLADVDALKPQINGDAHIHEQTDKEKELDSGTLENEKDATTEKEAKENGDEKEPAPITNGNTEQKAENGEPLATPEDGKKPKKEKVKKKWSLRSISFSRKDKPKQEKKQKEEDAKTNGEPEKVLEETTETAAEQSQNETVEEVKTPNEAKDDKTPETPVTEPITNGHSTPETPEVETPATETPVVEQVKSSDEVKTETKTETVPEPEQLPVNGLSIEESKTETPEVDVKTVEIVESKVEDSAIEKEVVPVPEIPVKKEVCVEQIPLIEPSPPPLPANPPPSSVASFAATTMAPEMTDASLSNTAEITFTTQETAETNVNIDNDTHVANPVTDSNHHETNNATPPPLKEEIAENNIVINPEIQTEQTIPTSIESINMKEKALIDVIDNSDKNTKVDELTPTVVVDPESLKSEDIIPEIKIENTIVPSDELQKEVEIVTELSKTDVVNDEQIVNSVQATFTDITVENNPPDNVKASSIDQEIDDINAESEIKTLPIKQNDHQMSDNEEINSIVPFEELPEVPAELTVMDEKQTNNIDFNNDVDELPPPPPLSDDEVSIKETHNSTEINDITTNLEEQPITKELVENGHMLDENKIMDTQETDEKLNNEIKDSSGDAKESTSNDNLKQNDATVDENNDESAAPETNAIVNEKGNLEAVENKIINDLVGKKAASGACNGSAEMTTSDEHTDLHTPQEPLPLSDKMDLIPDIPVIPELKTETETSTDVAVAN